MLSCIEVQITLIVKVLEQLFSYILEKTWQIELR
jgi:hypothetical protein